MAPGAEEQLEALGVPLSAPERFVAGLRAHAAAVGGASIAEYRSGAFTLRQHAEKLEALRALGRPGLLVREPPLLGAFGFELDSGLVNRDSLRFTEILIALDREDVLAELALQAAVAVEVGGGWGGLAFHLKTRFPGLRYVIVDDPARFLFSAVYVQAAFPDARVVYWPPEHADPDLLASADFVFVSHDALTVLELDRVDVALADRSLVQLETRRLVSVAEQLHRLGARRLYSLDRDPSGRLQEVLGRRYWLSEAWVLPWAHDRWVGEGRPLTKPMPEAGDALEPDRYSHLAGRRRLVPG